MRDYRNYRVIHAAHDLTLDVYKVTRGFPRDEIYGLALQMRRASVSIGSNLAEGCGRYSPAEFSRFVQIAMGSASELAYQLVLARDLGYFSPEAYDSFDRKLSSVRKMLTALQLKLNEGKTAVREAKASAGR